VRGAAQIEWRPEAGGGVSDSTVQLVRRDLEPSPTPPKPKGAGFPVPGRSQQPADVRLAVPDPNSGDPGGLVDRSVVNHHRYTYTAQRIRTVTVGGQELVLRSALSAPVTAEILTNFPPAAPTGLESSPAGLATPAIDLSWRPGPEPDLAGYNVYRADEGGTAWTKLTDAPVPTPGFRDTSVRPGGRYRYRVTAVDAEGNESGPGTEVQETAATS
jgi:hypothetical protein